MRTSIPTEKYPGLLVKGAPVLVNEKAHRATVVGIPRARGMVWCCFKPPRILMVPRDSVALDLTEPLGRVIAHSYAVSVLHASSDWLPDPATLLRLDTPHTTISVLASAFKR